MLSQPDHAASELRAILPPELAGRLDLARLEQAPDSYVDEELRWRHSDLVFTCPLDGKDAFVYVLIEHQSGPDALMPFRMLRYMVRIWDKYLNRHSKATKLPAIIPLVLHSNRRAWTGPTELPDLYDLDTDLAKTTGEFLPQFRFLLDDLARTNEAELRARPLSLETRITLVLLKTATGNRHLNDDLQAWRDDLSAIANDPGGLQLLIAIVHYIQTVSETPDEDLRRLFATLGSRAEEAYMTTADMLRAKGEARGEARLFVHLLDLRFGPLPQTALDTIHTATTDQIEAWTERVLTANTLDDILN